MARTREEQQRDTLDSERRQRSQGERRTQTEEATAPTGPYIYEDDPQVLGRPVDGKPNCYHPGPDDRNLGPQSTFQPTASAKVWVKTIAGIWEPIEPGS